MTDSIIKSKKLLCPHGFSTRLGGVSSGVYESLNLGMNRGDEDRLVCENWNRFLAAAGIENRTLVYGQQVHENTVHVATADDLKKICDWNELIEADGYVTAEKNIPLVIFTADCVPLLLEDTQAGVIGAIHCGWRSTVKDIPGNAIEAMVELGAKPQNIKAAIGPSIEKCCFEVGSEVITAAGQLLEKGIPELYTLKPNGKYMLDLKGVVQSRLIQLGVSRENIDLVGKCTCCNEAEYFSHRRMGADRGSLASVIMLK